MKFEIEVISQSDAWEKNGNRTMFAKNKTPNIPLLRKQVEWAESEEQRKDPTDHWWSQEDWFRAHRDKNNNICGTAACIAGNVGVLLAEAVCYCSDMEEFWGVRDEHGKYWAFEEFGREMLGLTRQESEMFAGHNEAVDIRLYAEEAAARVGEKL